MAEVQTYDAGGTQRRAPVTSARFQPATDGGDINKGLQDFGAGLQQVAKVEMEITDFEDEAAVKELAVRRTAFTTRLLYGDGTPENPGYLNMTGGDALRAEPDIRRQIEENDRLLLGEAGGGQRQRMFNQYLTNDFARDDQVISRHRSNETKAYNLASTTALIEARTNQAAAQLALGAPEGRVTLEAGRADVLDLLDQQGAETSPEILANAQRNYTSNIHAKAIGILRAQGNDTGALAYFEANKAEMTTDAQVAMGPALNASSDIATGRAQGLRAFTTANGDRAAAYAMVSPNWSPRQQDAARAEIDRRFQEREAAERDTSEARRQNLTAQVVAGADPRTLDTSGMSASEISSLDALAERRRKVDPAQGTAAFQRARILAIDNPEEFLARTGGTNATDLAGHMSESQWNTVMNIRAKLVDAQRRGVELEPSPADRAFKLGMTRAAPWLNANGIKNSGNTEQTYGAFQMALMEEIEARTAQAGDRPLNDAELDGAANAASQRVRGMRGVPASPGTPRPVVPAQAVSLLSNLLRDPDFRKDFPQGADVAVWARNYTNSNGEWSVPYDKIPKGDRDALIQGWRRANPGRAPTKRDIERDYNTALVGRAQRRR